MKRERERERKRESPALHEVSDKHEYLTPSRRRRGDGYQRASPASDPFTAAALLAQLDRDRALINWTGLSIQSLQNSAGLLSGSRRALSLWVMTSWNTIGSRAHALQLSRRWYTLNDCKKIHYFIDSPTLRNIVICLSAGLELDATHKYIPCNTQSTSNTSNSEAGR